MVGLGIDDIDRPTFRRLTPPTERERAREEERRLKEEADLQRDVRQKQKEQMRIEREEREAEKQRIKAQRRAEKAEDRERRIEDLEARAKVATSRARLAEASARRRRAAGSPLASLSGLLGGAPPSRRRAPRRAAGRRIDPLGDISNPFLGGRTEAFGGSIFDISPPRRKGRRKRKKGNDGLGEDFVNPFGSL